MQADQDFVDHLMQHQLLNKVQHIEKNQEEKILSNMQDTLSEKEEKS